MRGRAEDIRQSVSHISLYPTEARRLVSQEGVYRSSHLLSSPKTSPSRVLAAHPPRHTMLAHDESCQPHKHTHPTNICVCVSRPPITTAASPGGHPKIKKQVRHRHTGHPVPTPSPSRVLRDDQEEEKSIAPRFPPFSVIARVPRPMPLWHLCPPREEAVWSLEEGWPGKTPDWPWGALLLVARRVPLRAGCGTTTGGTIRFARGRPAQSPSRVSVPHRRATAPAVPSERPSPCAPSCHWLPPPRSTPHFWPRCANHTDGHLGMEGGRFRCSRPSFSFHTFQHR